MVVLDDELDDDDGGNCAGPNVHGVRMNRSFPNDCRNHSWSKGHDNENAANERDEIEN
jgi:hypothetical protein